MSEKTTTGARRRPVRPAIGSDPLDALLGRAEAPPHEPDARQAIAGRPASSPKIRATFHLPAALLDEARDTVVYLAGPPARLTLAELAETALRRELDRLKEAYNGGEDFPHRDADLRGGRPISS